MRYDIILIDADDTLLDFPKSEKKAFIETLDEFGVDFAEKMYDSFSANNDMLWKKFEKNEIEKSALIVARFALTFEEHGVELDAHTVNLRYMENLSTKADLIDGADEICRYISANARLFMITNASKKVQEKRLAVSGISHYFENIFISEDIGYVKPSYEYFDKVCSSIKGFCKEKTIVIGDSLTSDIRGANNYGLDCIFFNRKAKDVPPDLKVDFIIESLYEIKDIIT